ncbi:MAG TPA: MltA domain-containing protein [Rhizomicrobium sp.]|jgi:membrane-bound lytic murein transglycosylase A
MSRSAGNPRRTLALLAVIALVALGAAWLVLYSRPTAPVSLAPASFASLEGWRQAGPGAALAAFRRSCSVILKLPPTRAMGGIGYAGQARDWQPVCAEAASVQDTAARGWFEARFAVLQIVARENPDGLFTGYYEPALYASRTRHGAYVSPIYGQPTDLVTADLGLFHPDLAGRHLTGRVVGSKFIPYPARAQIDREGLASAPVLLYANDPVAVFFLHIQGSGRVFLDTGGALRLAYAGQNGRAYTPVGRVLIARGALTRAQMSMQAIRGWLQTHPAGARALMESDESYVFFRELPTGDPALGSPGSEGVPLTPGASVAVDQAVHPLGIPMFVTATVPDADPARADRRFARLCVAQDTGGAIKGGVRADIFWGFGAAAESIAGRLKSPGKLYVLLPRALAARLSPGRSGGSS